MQHMKTLAILFFAACVGMTALCGFGAILANSGARPTQADMDALSKPKPVSKPVAPKLTASERKMGPKPVPSEWDGITPEVNAFLRGTLKDYRSMKVVQASTVGTMNGHWCQRVTYRAKNSFGAYEIEDQVFLILNGKVSKFFDYTGN